MPEGLADRGIVALLGGALDRAEERRRVVPSAALLLLAWIGVVIYGGPQAGGRLPGALAPWIPPGMALGGVLVALGSSAIVALSRGVMPLALLAAMLWVYVAGTAASVHGVRVVSGLDVARWQVLVIGRLVYAATVLGPLALLLVAGRRLLGPVPLGFGSWRWKTRLAGHADPLVAWWQALLAVALLGGAPFLMLMQYTSQFAVVRSGDLARFIGPAALVAVVTAVVGEAVFRGCIQTAVIRCAGVGRGLWLQGLFFGAHHLGMGVSALGSVPGALAIGVGSVVVGKSVLETRGLGWAVVVHAVFGFGIVLAYGLGM